MTMQSVPAAVGLLIGNPIAGAVKDRGWVGLEVFSGCFVLAALGTAVGARVCGLGIDFVRNRELFGR